MSSRKPLSRVQEVALSAAHLSMAVSVLLVVRWAMGADTSAAMLGGLGFDDARIFNWHPLLMVVGFTLCMGEGIMAYRQFKLGKAGNKKIHVAWHTCGVVCVSLALRAVFKPHNVAKSPNLYTAHGIVGLSVVVLFYAQYALAAVSFLSSLSISPPAWRSVLLPWHVVIGIFCYLGSLAAIASGVAEKTAWLGCAYYVHGDKSLGKVQLDRPDINPAQHFGLLPDGCQLGIGVVVSALLAAFLVTLGTLSIKVGAETDEKGALPYDRVPNSVL